MRVKKDADIEDGQMTVVVPKRVLHVMNTSEGGAARSTVQLIEKLNELGIASCAVCHVPGTDVTRQEILDATKGRAQFFPLYWWNIKNRAKRWKRPLIELRQGFKTGASLRSSARTAQLAREWGVDLIHTNSVLVCEGAYAARMLRLPHVWHVRELLAPYNYFRLPLAGEAFLRFLEDHASVVVANSEVTASTIGYPFRLDAERLRVVPNGIDETLFSSSKTGAKGDVVIGMVANLTSVGKRHDLFIDMASHLMEDPRLTFHIYGDDPSNNGQTSGGAYADSLNAQIDQLGLRDRLVLKGYVPHAATIMKGIDILVHPFARESFGRIVIEAMAAGCAVVGPRGGGVGEIVDHGRTGLLVNDEDAAALADAVRQLVANPKLRENMGLAGRREVCAKYTLNTHAQKMVATYSEAMMRPLAWRGTMVRHT